MKRGTPRARGAWVVTGAASGFGREVARRLHANGEAIALGIGTRRASTRPGA